MSVKMLVFTDHEKGAITITFPGKGSALIWMVGMLVTSEEPAQVKMRSKSFFPPN